MTDTTRDYTRVVPGCVVAFDTPDAPGVISRCEYVVFELDDDGGAWFENNIGAWHYICDLLWRDWQGRIVSHPDDKPATPAEPTIALSKALGMVAAERDRQKSAKNYTEEHDDAHSDGALIWADWGALPRLQSYVAETSGKSPLIEAAALIIAEMERLDRADIRVATDATPPEPTLPLSEALAMVAAEREDAARYREVRTQFGIDAALMHISFDAADFDRKVDAAIRSRGEKA